jgi:hypothetical protein
MTEFGRAFQPQPQDISAGNYQKGHPWWRDSIAAIRFDRFFRNHTLKSSLNFVARLTR